MKQGYLRGYHSFTSSLWLWGKDPTAFLGDSHTAGHVHIGSLNGRFPPAVTIALSWAGWEMTAKWLKSHRFQYRRAGLLILWACHRPRILLRAQLFCQNQFLLSSTALTAIRHTFGWIFSRSWSKIHHDCLGEAWTKGYKVTMKFKRLMHCLDCYFPFKIEHS